MPEAPPEDRRMAKLLHRFYNGLAYTIVDLLKIEKI